MTIDLATYGGSKLPLGLVGAAADAGPRRIETFINESATGLDFGLAVCLGAPSTTQRGNIKPVSGATDLLVGITFRDPNRVPNSSGQLLFQRYEDVPVMMMGKIFVLAAETVRRGDAVVVLTAGAGTLASPAGGVIGSGRLALVGATWDSDTVSGQIGIILLAGGQTQRLTT